MRWILPREDPSAAERVAQALDLHPVLGRVLVARGLATPEAAQLFLRDGLSDLPDPSLLKGMDLAVDRLSRALAAGEKVTLWGDYDVDGVTSTALLKLFLAALGAQVATYIPHRLGEGYGLNAEGVERIAADGTRVLVSLDCGISAAAEVARANARGLEVIVIDHHQVGAALPPALAVIDPHQPGCAYPGKELCAAGLAFQVAVALRRALRERGFFASRREPNLREYLDLVAIGTVGDVVPLVGVNRILVRHGLAELARARRPGVRALKAASGLGAEEPVSAGQVGFRLAPRLNAAGRLADASAGVDLLTTSDERRAEALARELDGANRDRQSLEKSILSEALSQAAAAVAERGQRRTLVLAADGWHPGVIGIVASRVVERFHRPTFVVGLSDGEGRGSGRSIEGFHLYQALASCAQHLKRFGGHRHAAGLSLARSSLPSFSAAFEACGAATLTDEQMIPRCRVDALLGPEELKPANAFSLLEGLARLSPFGAGNPEPVFAWLGLTGAARVLAAKNGAEGHLKLAVHGAPHLDVIGFGLARSAPLAGAPLDLAFQLASDAFGGIPRVSLRVKALRTSGRNELTRVPSAPGPWT
jgi:single-stranded-DNA-specific exonuclease